MRALVTGAAGFIGSTLVDRLLAEGHQVVGVDSLTTGVTANLRDAVDRFGAKRDRFAFVQADVQAPELTDIVAGAHPDVVFHLAAQVDLRASVSDPFFDARSNVLGTINLCEAARQADVPRIVYAASGGSRYGSPTTVPVDENAPLNPLSPYAVAKAAGELYLRAYAAMYGISAVCLALANVYGPRQNPFGEAGVIAVFGTAMITGAEATIFGDGSAARDFVYVDDVVDAFVRAATARTLPSDTYNIGTATMTTVTEVFDLISAAMGSTSAPLHAPGRIGELRAIALDNSKAQRDLGWTPGVALADGIPKTLRWLQVTVGPDSIADIGA